MSYNEFFSSWHYWKCHFRLYWISINASPVRICTEIREFSTLHKFLYMHYAYTLKPLLSRFHKTNIKVWLKKKSSAFRRHWYIYIEKFVDRYSIAHAVLAIRLSLSYRCRLTLRIARKLEKKMLWYGESS